MPNEEGYWDEASMPDEEEHQEFVGWVKETYGKVGAASILGMGKGNIQNMTEDNPYYFYWINTGSRASSRDIYEKSKVKPAGKTPEGQPLEGEPKVDEGLLEWLSEGGVWPSDIEEVRSLWGDQPEELKNEIRALYDTVKRPNLGGDVDVIAWLMESPLWPDTEGEVRHLWRKLPEQERQKHRDQWEEGEPARKLEQQLIEEGSPLSRTLQRQASEQWVQERGKGFPELDETAIPGQIQLLSGDMVPFDHVVLVQKHDAYGIARGMYGPVLDPKHLDMGNARYALQQAYGKDYEKLLTKMGTSFEEAYATIVEASLNQAMIKGGLPERELTAGPYPTAASTYSKELADKYGKQPVFEGDIDKILKELNKKREKEQEWAKWGGNGVSPPKKKTDQWANLVGKATNTPQRVTRF